MTTKTPARPRRTTGTATRDPLRVLLVSAELSPFMKTGGLADSVAGLAGALAALGHDVRVLTPAYGETLAGDWRLEPETRFRAPARMRGTGLLAAELPRTSAQVWLLEHPSFGERRGNPYVDSAGTDFPDNGERFDLLCRAATAIAADAAGLAWRPDVVHANDWHAALVPVRMMLARVPAAVVFTVHNLAYQGLFAPGLLARLGLPPWLWHPEALEFYGRLNFLKGGLVFADRLTTVSATFAREMLTATYGEGLEGVLQQRAADLVGIVNGLDRAVWDPAADPYLPAPYSAADPAPKALSTAALRERLGLAPEPERALVAVIGRLVPQKGIDLVLGALPALLERPVQLAVLGSGLVEYERALAAAAAAHPGRVSVTPGYDEGLAHLMEAGADLLLMPSRYEPCGLTQMQSMAYGTVPIVRACGGLADTVVDATGENLATGTATGFVFGAATVPELLDAVGRALALRADPAQWRALMRAGMRRDFSWRRSARAYLEVYRRAAARAAP